MSDRVCYDRFSGAESLSGKEVGSCTACGGVMYDYEAAECDDCKMTVHADCLKICENCAHIACRTCMKQDKETLDWFCSEDCIKEYNDTDEQTHTS